MAFSAGGAFGTHLYIANGIRPPFDISRADSSGAIDPFVEDFTFDAGLGPVDIEFGPGAAFGTDLYFSDRGDLCKCIRTADAGGNFSAVLAFFDAQPISIGFGPGGGFGDALYVALDDGTIWTMQPDGSSALFASGFEFVIAGMDALEFSPDGSSLYVASFGDDTIYRITAPASVPGLGPRFGPAWVTFLLLLIAGLLAMTRYRTAL